MKNIFLLLFFLLSFHNIKSFSFNTEVPSVERKYVNEITSDSLGNYSMAHAIPVYQRPTGRDSILTQAVNTASSLSGTEKFEMLFSTTGYGFESDLVNHPTGINSEFIPRIEAFHYNWGWGITGLSVIIPWDKFEPTPGNYQLNALQKVIDYCDARGFTLSIKFWAVRSEGDGFLQPSEMVKGSLGRTFSMVDIPGFRDVYPSYGCDRTNVLIFNAVKKIAEKLNTYSRAGYMCLAGGHTEELVNHVIDNGGASSQLADFSEDNLARFNSWVSSRGITGPGTPPMIHGNGVSWPHPNFSQPLGLEFSRFLSFNLGKYERNFVNAVKSVSNIPTLYYYAASSNSQLRATSNANMNYISAANDGMYGSEGDGVYDHQGKFRCNSINLGNFPNGISAVEFDPDDCSTWRNSNAGIPPYCHNQFDLNTVKNSMEALYSKGTRYIHLTMAYCPTEILTMSNMMQQLHQSYIGKTYVRPVINSSNTVSVEVTQKYRNSEDLLSGIDFTNKYVKYTDNDFWGGISPNPQTCTPPEAPVLTTSANTISSGQSTTLTAVGCSGNLHWSTGQTSANILVSPAQTTTYTATCSVNGCTSSLGSITITVLGTPSTNINCSTLSSDFGSADCNFITGWIYDSSNPNTVVNLDIYEGNTLIQANIPASNFRQDLLNAGIGNGYHAFQFATPSQLKTDQSRNISLRASGCSYVLTNSPRTISCGGCTPPAAPGVSASITTITSGQSVTLTSIGCSGNLNWSTGQITTNISVSPTQTTTYSATCTVNGCTSPAGSVTIMVSGTPPTNINCSTLSSDFGSANCDVLSGWIYDSSNPNTVVNLDIYEGNTLIQANIPASNFRQDLLNAGIGNGYHAFQFATPSQLKTGQSRNISLRASGCGYVFTNSPRTISCGGCTAPAAPAVSASITTIISGQSVTLTSNGCSGNLNWSTGQSLATISVIPTQTTTYSATCTVNGCVSPAGSVTITVSGTPSTNINCSTLSSDFGFASCDVLSGWIYDSSSPNLVVNLDIYEGNTLIQANIPASNFRQDLLNAGIGNGYHAFQFATPSQLKTGQSRNISLRASGCSYVFTNSPKVINCNAGARISANFEPEEVLAEQELTASPNPSKGDFIVSFQLPIHKTATLTVYDLTGNIIYNKIIQGKGRHNERMNLKDIISGTYFVSLKKESGRQVKKVIVIK